VTDRERRESVVLIFEGPADLSWSATALHTEVVDRDPSREPVPGDECHFLSARGHDTAHDPGIVFELHRAHSHAVQGRGAEVVELEADHVAAGAGEKEVVAALCEPCIDGFIALVELEREGLAVFGEGFLEAHEG